MITNLQKAHQIASMAEQFAHQVHDLFYTSDKFAQKDLCDRVRKIFPGGNTVTLNFSPVGKPALTNVDILAEGQPTASFVSSFDDLPDEARRAARNQGTFVFNLTETEGSYHEN